MAQKIVSLCDPHLTEHDEEVPGEPYRIGLCPPGERWQWVSIDLCAADAGALEELGAWLVKYGRTSEPPKPGALVPRKPPRAERLEEEAHVCPVCGAKSVSRQALGQHLRHSHGKGLTDINPGRTCSECGFEAATAQGLGTHKARKHPSE